MRKILAACGAIALVQAHADARHLTSDRELGPAIVQPLDGPSPGVALKRAADRPSHLRSVNPDGAAAKARVEATGEAEPNDISATLAFLLDVYGPAPETKQSQDRRREYAQKYIDSHPGMPGVLFIEDVVDHGSSNTSVGQHQLEFRQTLVNYYVGGGTLNDTVFGFIDGPYPPMWTTETSAVYTSLIYVDAQGNETYVSQAKVNEMAELAPGLSQEMMQRQETDRRYKASQVSLAEAIKQSSDSGKDEGLQELRQRQQQLLAEREEELRKRQQRDAEMDRMYELGLRADSGTISLSEQKELDNYIEKAEPEVATGTPAEPVISHALKSCPICRRINVAALRGRHFTGTLRFISNSDRSLVKVYRHGCGQAIAVLRSVRSDLSGPIFGTWTNAGMVSPPTQDTAISIP
ncbi:hypothetical protein [Bradyrhizobium sp. STM 3562]|uniref:hypothetical protein n=1 Tax=Bradyrhizobium sp. STM 3562 TaxID=578924 RepID=UPI0038907E2B